MADIKEHINDHTLEEGKLSSNEAILRDILIARLRSSGIEVITDKKEVKELLDNYQALGNSDIRYQSVFHGSGVNFDHFDHSHMGEGEGAQSHGWGTYVTLDEKVGKKYASKSDQATGLKRSELEFKKHRTEDQLSFLRGEVKASKEKELKNLKDELNNLDKSRFLYTVDIPDNTGYNYLEENAPLSEEQQKMLAEESEKEGFGDNTLSYRDENGNLMLNVDTSNGLWLYRNELTRVLGSPKAASEFLSRAGFTGIHYYGRKDGDCYVIFDEKNLNIEDKIKFFKTSNGDAYGFTLNSKIYVDTDIANSETPIHEYAHLWAATLRAGNEHEWNNVVALMKQQTDIWDSVKSRYPQLSSDDDIADEVLATYSGQRGAKLLREQMKGIMGENNTKSSSMFDAFEEAIKRFWHDVADMLHIHYIDSEQVSDQIMSDMLNGVNPNEVKKEAFVRQEFESLVDSNKKFNERLSSLMEEPHQKDQRLRMGYASTFLREGGLADGMIFLQYNKILRKSSESYKNNHPFDIASLRNLPIAIAYPITVFEDTNNKKTGNTILTELSDGNHNFIVAVKTVNEHRTNGVSMEINDITTLFPKEEKGIINWYNTDKATNIDKKKALRFISSLQTHSGNEINSEELSSAANIINKFEKAKYQEDNFDKTFKEVSSDRRYVEAVASGHIEEARQMLVERAKSKGYLPADYQGKDSWSAPVAEVEPSDFDNKEALQQMVDDFGSEANVYGIINGIQGHDSDYYYNPDAVGFHGQAANETAEILRRLRDEHASGDTQVDIYRVVPNDVVGSQIMQGDWVALSKIYCDELGKHKFGDGNYHIIEAKAAIKNLWMGDEDMREFGFDDGHGDVEKNVRHNRKILDITYDDEGKLIPLSQRFSENNEDIRFQLSDDDNQKYKSNIYEMSEENSPKEKLSSETKRTMETFAEQLVKTMQEMKNSDWKQGWSLGSHGMFGLPMNISGYTYNGINGVITAFDTFKNGYNSPIYLTMKQANAHGWKINEGEHLTRILNYGVSRKYNGKYISQETFDNLPDEEKAKVKKSSHLHVYYEFNLDQTNCHEVNPDLYNKLISLYRGQAPAHDSKGMYVNPELDRMFKKQEWVCPINCDKPSSSAFYRPFTDSITIPLKDQFKISKTEDGIFKDGQEYYSTALHEMAHSTGHESRLNRSLSGEFGSASYAKEELIAEMSSAFVCSALGFDKRINRNSAAYLDSWVKKLSDDPTYIKNLMSPVKKASMMILEGIDKQRLALGMEPLVRNGEVDLVKLAESQSAKQDVNVSSIKEVVVDDKDKNQQVQETSEKESMQEFNKHDTGDTLDKDAIADGYANNLEKQWDEVVKMFGQDENLFDQLTAAASGQPLDSVKHTDKFDIVHDFINQFGGKKELGAETETTTGALYNSHSVAQLKLNDGSILEVNDYSKAFDDSVKDVQELSHVRDGAIIDSARKEIGADNQNINQETLNNLWSAFAGSAPMNRPQEQHLVDKKNDTAEGKNPNSGIEDNDKTKVISTGSYYATETDRSAVLALNDMLHDLRNGYEVFNHLNDYVKSRQEVSHRLKAGNISPIEPSMLMSHELMGNIDKNHLDKYVLVPVPSHTGKANLTLVLASAISTQTGIEVTDLLEGKEHEPFYGVKKYQGSNGLDPDKIDFGFKVKDGMQLPEGKVPVLVDNVLDTGKTISDSAKVLGAKERLALVFANTDNWKEHPSYDIELAPSNTIRASKDSKSINDIVAQASRLVTVEDQDANNPLQQRSHLSQAAVAVNYLNHIRENKGYSWFHDEKNWNVPVRKDIYLESPAEHIKSVANQSKLDLENEVRSLIDKYYDENAPKELYYYDTWSDEKLLTYMKLDGGGDLNKANNVDVYEEFDARHSSDIMAIGERFMDQLVDNHASLNDAEKQLDDLRQKDISLWATPERVELIGKEETLNDYITNYEKVLRTQQKEVNLNMEESDKPTVTVKATPAKEWYLSVNYLQSGEDVELFSKMEKNEDYKGMLESARNYDFSSENDWDYRDTFKSNPVHYNGDVFLDEDEDYAVVSNNSVGGTYSIFRKVTEADLRERLIEDGYGTEKIGDFDNRLSDDVKTLVNRMVDEIDIQENGGKVEELVEDPMMKTFYQIKAERPNNLLLFQSENGDFYNSYKEDASKVSEILRLPLQESDTVKDRNGQFVDTCVFPKHTLSTYLPKLVRAGEKVILVDNPVINRDKSEDKQKTPHEDSDMRTDVTDTAKQIVASDNVPMEQAEKEAKEIADEQVHKEFHQQQDKLHAEEEKQQQVEKQEQEKKRQEQEQAKKQKVMNPKLYDVFGMKDGQRELVKEGLGIVAAATFVERNSERYQRKGYDYLISMPHVEETLEKSQLKDADMPKEQSPQEQEGKERKNPYQPLFEGTREEAKQIVDALKNDMENPDNTIPYDEILRDATLYGETPLYADKEWYKKYAEGKSDPEIAGLYRRALATLETIPEQQATVKSISDNTVESNQEQEDMNKKEEQLKQQAKKEEELHKEESSMSEPVTPKASSDDSVKEQTEQTKEPFSKEDEKVVNTAAVHAGLLLGALESAKEGIWLNPHGKHGAALLEPGKMITGYNRLMMDLFADKNHYKTNVFTYYDYAKKEEMPVKQGQTSLPIDWTRWDYENVATKEVITKEQYAELTPDKQQDYARHSTKQTRHLYNIDQTAMAGTKVADYSKLVKDNGSKFEDIPELPTDKNFLNLTNRLHGKHKDCTIILGEGEKNFAYGAHAEKVGSVMGVPVQSKDIDGKKVAYIEFPHNALDSVLPKMIRSHNKVALCSNVLESKFEASNNISKNSVRDAATVADKVSRKAGFTLERVLDDVPVSYDKEKDVITYSGNNARQPGRENLAAVQKANDIYRAVVEATGRENRLDREARFNMLPEDNAKYEKLVQELSAGVLMASHGLPAIISKENRELIPYWEREIKENPKMMAVLEKDVNNSIEQIEKHLLGQEVDYAKVRGARPALFDAKDYTVASKMAQLPNVETKEFVIIRNAEKTAADVILPEGATLPEGASLPGMSKERIVHALAKENINEVHFYNAGGAQGLYKDNDYFAGKTATLTKLKQWELLPRHVVDISSQYLNVEKKPLIERFRAIPDDSHRWAFNIKAKGEGQFSVYPAKEYLNAYFTARNNPNKVEKAKMMSSLAQRYYAVAQAHPEVKKELIMPKVPEGVDMSKLTGTTIGRDKDDHSKVFVQSTIDGAFHKEPITMAQYQRMWLADDMQDYKNAIAANAFASIIKSAKAQQEADEGLKIVDNSNVKDVVGHSEKQDQGHSESHSDGGSSDSDDKSESEGQGVGDASSKQADKDKSEEENKSRGFHM